IVVPGELLGRTEDVQPGQNTYVEGGSVYALRLGVKTVRGDRVNVISLSGRYEPFRGDMVIGTIAEVGPSNWYINIGAANDVGMHVNDVPWRVEFGETSKYLAVGDTVLLKIVHVDEMKKAQVSMKDRQCRKLTGGLIFEVAPTKVPRIVGRQGSMITMLKDATNVRIFVGQNGKIWMDGEPEDVALALEALKKIEAEAHTTGLTDRMKAWLEERRPSAQRTHKQSSDMEAEAEEDREITRERREDRRERPERRPRSFEEPEAEERPRRPRFEDEGAQEDDTADADLEERKGRDGRFGEREERRHGGPRRDRPERREERPRRFDDERPARKPRFEEAEERPARRFEAERPARKPQFDDAPPRRAPRDERPRRFAEEEP